MYCYGISDFHYFSRPSSSSTATVPSSKPIVGGLSSLFSSPSSFKTSLRHLRISWYNNSNKGFGVYSSDCATDGILLVVPLNLAITPMRVVQDPILGPVCSTMFEEGEVDDRFLIILFLTFESIRKNSSWKPYLNMLPTTFENPLWFSEDELLDVKRTTLFKATELQKKSLQSLYGDKVKDLVKKLLILDGDLESEVCFNDFLWDNSIFWTRALSIPLPRSFVFPQIQEEDHNPASNPELADGDNGKKSDVNFSSTHEETVWVEGLLPGIDFCNHDLKAAATWEVDGTGSATGVPLSMYLLSGNYLSLNQYLHTSYFP
ncbi:hypothetical protein L1987_54409 [Smallanthus sonchifolius]|uniref:Uncharacterized protein n=1 Tax=Smallanthus sonchifolius TaxID=185202 RepID=A0ACB9E725_9ASTR|nr:hypothetical protein L1987_54409 [Smallanthus sonchifolius]